MNGPGTRGLVGLVLVSTLMACSVVPASPSASTGGGEASPVAAATATSAPSIGPLDTTTPSPSGPIGGGPLMVFQLDSRSPEKAVSESVFRVDVGTGERTEFGSLPVDATTCCPEGVTWTTDRSRALLSAIRIVGIADVAGRTVGRVSGKQSIVFGAISHAGDRSAWVDDLTGTAETIVISDLGGKTLRRLGVPAGAWDTRVTWSPDDASLAVVTHLPLASARTDTGPSIALARFPPPIIACCTVDHGITPAHILVVPVDGSPTRDLIDQVDGVTADMSAPPPTPPAGLTFVGDLPRVERSYGDVQWSPDGRALAVSETVCQPRWRFHDPTSCAVTLTTVDAETGQASPATSARISSTASLTWSPDGHRLAFVGTSATEASGIFLVDPTAGTMTRVTEADEWVGWSPDGTWLVFRRVNPDAPDRTDRVDVWVIPVAGGAPRLIAEHAAAGW
jgi:hypothetical protein